MSRTRNLLVPFAAVAALAASQACAHEMKMPNGKMKAMPSDASLIESAMHAAPARVGAGATVAVANPDGSMRTVRAGNNGFTCMPDNPVTPGPDPMCMDAAAMEWAGAWMGHTTPVPGKIGLMYMLSGGTDASNTDPYATRPGANSNWVKTGAHLMVVGADAAFYAMYPKSANPDTTVPYVMWAGTPYQHLMIPIK